MDLNQLLFHHQVALIRKSRGAVAAMAPASSRFDLVQHYEHRIGRLRRKMGVIAYPASSRLSSTAI